MKRIIGLLLVMVLVLTICGAYGAEKSPLIDIKRDSGLLVGLRADGTVEVFNKKGDAALDGTSAWNDIAQIFSACDGQRDGWPLYCVIGITADGTLRACGHDNAQKINGWKNVRSLIIALNDDVCGAVMKDGTVRFIENLSTSWSKVVSVVPARNGYCALRENGKVLTINTINAVRDAVAEWSGIERIYSSVFGVIGLDSNGTLYTVSDTGLGWCPYNLDKLNGLRGVKDFWVSMSNNYAAALMQDGTVMMSGDGSGNEDAPKLWQLPPERGWEEVERIIPSYQCMAGVRSDGKIAVFNFDALCYLVDPDFFVDPEQPLIDFAWYGTSLLGLTTDGKVVQLFGNPVDESILAW